MSRHKDADWSLPGPQIQTWEQVGIAVLMDIRDELKRLNGLLHCPNCVDIPNILRHIDKNTKKRRYTRRKKTNG